MALLERMSGSFVFFCSSAPSRCRSMRTWLEWQSVTFFLLLEGGLAYALVVFFHIRIFNFVSDPALLTDFTVWVAVGVVVLV